ncbi:MAG: hypothetical protein IPK10_07985 [Bacteroidetes bacterium]|nr:hypothetical protein [Bacteroidota bacterium]
MLERIWEFLFPSNSNAKNRNEIFLWFLVCFVIAIVITFWNGYQLGKCNCSEKNLSLTSDTLHIKNLEAENKRLKLDGDATRIDINKLKSKIDYEKLKDLNDPFQLTDYSQAISLLEIKDSSMQNIKSVVAAIIQYKSDIITHKSQSIDSLNEVLSSLIGEINKKKKSLENPESEPDKEKNDLNLRKRQSKREKAKAKEEEKTKEKAKTK